MILFSKYHGCGNNFVIIKETELSGRMTPDDYPQLAIKVCNVNTGIGADGMIVVREDPALEMVFYNCDGSRAPMCGNGIRCFANFCRDEGIETGRNYPVKTLAGDMIVDVTSGEPFRVRINMGKPMFSPEEIKVDSGRTGSCGADSCGENFLGQSLTLADGSSVEIDSMFMGTIHTVVFVDELDESYVQTVGEEICNHPTFTEKTNVNFVKVVDEDTLKVQTYERGVGVTLACGTGACASVLAANLRGKCGSRADVQLKLGSLNITLSEDGDVYMEGPSEKICSGTIV